MRFFRSVSSVVIFSIMFLKLLMVSTSPLRACVCYYLI
jgi:hypothetical protein